MWKFTVCALAIFLSISDGASLHSLDRIVGGADAEEGAAPYQVGLFAASGRFFCGGSIISRRTILTAAHCVDTLSTSDLLVLVGTNSLTQGGTKYSVSGIKVHESWDPYKVINDIALVFLSASLELSDKVRIIDLGTEYLEGGEDVVATGWGLLGVSQPNPDKLQILYLKTTTLQQCDVFGVPITTDQICTFTRAGEGLCSSDSGGPLVKNGSVVGVVSFGYPCATGVPDVYARVSAYNSWILGGIVN